MLKQHWVSATTLKLPFWPKLKLCSLKESLRGHYVVWLEQISRIDMVDFWLWIDLFFEMGNSLGFMIQRGGGVATFVVINTQIDRYLRSIHLSFSSAKYEVSLKLILASFSAIPICLNTPNILKNLNLLSPRYFCISRKIHYRAIMHHIVIETLSIVRRQSTW